jgi:hypothetical protein
MASRLHHSSPWQGELMPAPSNADYWAYNEWLHRSEDPSAREGVAAGPCGLASARRKI